MSARTCPSTPAALALSLSVALALSAPPALAQDWDAVEIGVQEVASGVYMLTGRGGNIVLSGHNNIKGEVFRYLEDLEPGDTITLYTGNQPYEYAVADKFILKDKGEPEAVRRANARWIGPFNEERVTLVTCWPYTNNTYRLIVIAHPISKNSNTINGD